MANFLTRHFNFLSKKPTDEEIEAIFQHFTEKAAFKQLAVYIATSYIANALSGCEIKVIREGKEVDNDLLYYRLNVSPNPNQSGAQLMNALVTRLCLETDALVVPHKSDMLYLADSFSIDPHPLKDDVFRGVSVERKTPTTSSWKTARFTESSTASTKTTRSCSRQRSPGSCRGTVASTSSSSTT